MKRAEAMSDRLRHSFEQRFGPAPELGAEAPGRVNLIGEHTDYSEGWVLPLAIDRRTRVVGRRRDDRRFRVWADDLGDAAEFELGALAPRRHWVDYVQAVVWALGERGVDLRGCDLAIASDVPRECGLSSSAALGVAIAAALDAAHDLGESPLDWARTAHRGESEFVGVGCGIMDQYASALGRRDCALRIDCRSRETEPVPLPGDQVAIVVADSGVQRALAGPEAGYLDRVAECRAAVEAAREAGVVDSEVATLRDFTERDLPGLERALEPRLFRRARHVITENARVTAVCESLALLSELGPTGLASVGECLMAGQESLRVDFEVSTPELDALCGIANAQPGVYGSRLTGAGLGGCTIHLVAPPAADRLATVLATEYERAFGRRPAIHRVRPSDGAAILPRGSF